MMKKTVVFWMFFCLMASMVQAQAVYTLDSCKRLAVKGNLTLQNHRLAIESARQTKKEAFTKFFPSVSAIGFAFKTNRYMMDFDYDLGRWQTGFFSPVMISIDLPSIPMQMLDGGLMGGVTAVQPLFAGLRIVHGNQLAKLGWQAAEKQAEMSEAEVCELVEGYYWQIVALCEKRNTLMTLGKQLEHIHQDVEAAVEAGVTTPNNLLMVKLKEQELASGQLKVENGIRMYKKILRQTAQIPEIDFELAVDSLAMPEMPQGDYMDPQQGASQRTESTLLDMQVRASELQTRMEMGKYLPQVAVGAGYSAYWMQVNSDNTAANHFGMVFGTVSVPLSDWWGGAHAIQKSRIQEQIARNERTQNMQLIEMQIERSWDELAEAYQQLILARNSIDLARENLRLQQDYFDAGTATLTELLNAQSTLQQSADNYTEAFVDYQVKRRAYLKNIGKPSFE